MMLAALIADDGVLDPVAAALARRGHAIHRAAAARLAAAVEDDDAIDLVVLAPSSDAAICRAIHDAAPLTPIAVAGPIDEAAAIAALLDAGAEAHIITAQSPALFEAQLLALERTARARATRRRAPEHLSNDPFRHLVELATSFCFRARFPPEGRFSLEWVTPGFTALTGVTMDDLAAGYPLRRTIHPADLPRATAWIRRVRAGEPASLQMRLLTKDGDERRVRAAAEPLRDHPGQRPRGVLGVVKDLTAEVRAAEDLRDRAAALEAIIHNSPLSIITLDYAGNIVRWNPAAERLFGWTAEEAIGKPHPAVPPSEQPAFQRMIEDAFCGRLEPLVEVERRRKDGSALTASVARAVLTDAHGAPTGMVAIIADITEKKQLEAKLRMADRLASVGRLAAAVGHEINNPLTYVLTNMRLVLEQLRGDGDEPPRAVDAETIEMLREAREGAERVRLIVRDLRMFSQAEDEERVPVDPRRVLDACVNMTRVELRHRARVVRRYEETPEVLANEARLGQVVLNLLINAADSMQSDDLDRNEIQLSTRIAGDGRVAIEVRDTGTGMPKEVQERIFEPFFTTKASGRGTGLGLSVCYSIVRALGGEITVESETGRGTCFRVLLPAAPVEAASSANGARPARGSDQRPRRGLRPLTGAGPAGGRARLLIIDDEAQVARAIARFLREHDVTLAESGQAALAAIRGKGPFDVILCDLMMPDLTGMDVHEQIRKEQPGLEERVIFMTGGVFTDQAAAFLSRVPNVRLEKPFDPAAVKSAVASLLKR